MSSNYVICTNDDGVGEYIRSQIALYCAKFYPKKDPEINIMLYDDSIKKAGGDYVEHLESKNIKRTFGKVKRLCGDKYGSSFLIFAPKTVDKSSINRALASISIMTKQFYCFHGQLLKMQSGSGKKKPEGGEAIGDWYCDRVELHMKQEGIKWETLCKGLDIECVLDGEDGKNPTNYAASLNPPVVDEQYKEIFKELIK